MTYTSPISPGRSWYEDSAGPRPDYAPLEDDRRADVVIVGGGYTGLSAAAHLAEAGVGAVVLEAHRCGDGASGRNGGQLGTGPRIALDELEEDLGWSRAKALFDLAEDAKAHLHAFAAHHAIDIDYVPGQLSVAHKPRYVDDYRRYADYMRTRAGYEAMSFMDRDETAERLGSDVYHGGVRDLGTGHVHPMKLLIGTARAAAAAGATIHERSPATRIKAFRGGVRVTTPRGVVHAERALIAVNAHGGDLDPVGAAHVLPIGSFMAATEPLGADSPILPGGESVYDSRFVVRYFRRTADRRLLFGGREAYAGGAGDITASLRRQIASVYPGLVDVPITHGWGGLVGVTVPRLPFLREVMPRVIACGGYSGHGVVLANYAGRLYAESVSGRGDELRLLRELRIPAFPGGRRFRSVLLFLALSWYALRDRI